MYAGAGLQPVSTAQYQLVTSSRETLRTVANAKKATRHSCASPTKKLRTVRHKKANAKKGNAPFLRQPNKNTSNSKAQEDKRKKRQRAILAPAQ